MIGTMRGLDAAQLFGREEWAGAVGIELDDAEVAVGLALNVHDQTFFEEGPQRALRQCLVALEALTIDVNGPAGATGVLALRTDTREFFIETWTQRLVLHFLL